MHFVLFFFASMVISVVLNNAVIMLEDILQNLFINQIFRGFWFTKILGRYKTHFSPQLLIVSIMM